MKKLKQLIQTLKKIPLTYFKKGGITRTIPAFAGHTGHTGIRGARGPRATDYGPRATEKFGDSLTSDLRPLTSARGIALVAVLAILVVLAIMAASFTALMNIENKQSSVQIKSQQLDMLINSGLEQAKAIITVDELEATEMDKVSDIAGTFSKMSPGGSGESAFSKWFLVKDKTGSIFGRYRIRLEDEAAKVNVNKAFLLKDSKGTGWDTGEVVLPRALGVPRKSADKIIKYRYGKNNLPGTRGDDDQNNLILMADGIDNDADGFIDEDDEGINDPREYSAEKLKGDDTKFSSMTEMMNIIIDDKKISDNLRSGIMKELPRRATIYSIDKPGSPTLPNKIPADINSITTRECRKLLIKANAESPFEPNSSKQQQLAANIIDYRDENHVLSTLGSTYGVEAICFNELLANDESTTLDLVYARLGTWWVPSGFWEENTGMVDDKRPIYCVDTMYGCIPDSPSMISKRFQAFDPRRMWRIRKTSTKTSGKLLMKGSRITIDFPDTIGPDGYKNRMEILPYTSTGINSKPQSIPPANKNYLSWPSKSSPTESAIPDNSKFKRHCDEMLEILRKIRMKDGSKNRPDLPKNYFRDSLVTVYRWQTDGSKDEYNKAVGVFKILSGDEKSITFEDKNYYSNNSTYNFENMLNSIQMSNGYYDLSISINSWANGHASIAWVPNANQMFLLRSRQPIAGKYYKIIFGRLPKSLPTDGESGMRGYSDLLGASQEIGGDFTADKNYERKMWVCNNGKPMKTKSGGWMNVLITSSPEVSREQSKGQMLTYIRLLAPEVAEMYNASATPVSLANWRVICNTGTLATQIGRIRNTAYYDQKLRRRVIDNNPVVQPGGHFYLVNDTELFDNWYGNEDEKWGSKADEQVPVFQMDEQNWGVAYDIEDAKVSLAQGGVQIKLANFSFDTKEVFRNETVKFIDEKGETDPFGWNNVFAPVRNDTAFQAKNEFFVWKFGNVKKLENAKVMILGLPASGGMVSLTLKNEYDQVCARTVNYGKLKPSELGVSTEKIDPTKNTWIKRQNPSIGGTENEALNKAMQSHRSDTFFIKNGHYCSIAELGRVTTGGDFERVAGSGDISKGINALSGLASVMVSSFIRLESCLGDVTRVGWKQAYDEVDSSTLRSITCKTGGWAENKWAGHTLRFLTGPLRGEKFPIVGNSKKTITLGERDAKYIPRSSPNRKPLKPNKENKFSIGSGYSTPMCYTRKSGDSAVWTWENAVPYSGTYHFYIHGLNDAIDTTEFLEENNNASLDIELWNYETKEFDTLKQKAKYGKQDSINAGKIKPENISRDGSVKMRLTAHNVAERNIGDKSGQALVGSGGKQSGVAWFNYAMITPVPVPGRVNINTAPSRLLASLPGINSKIAENISDGIDWNNKKTLKPYQKLGDVLKVKGMTPDIFEKCANILALDSSAFTVEIEAQVLKSSITSEKQNLADNILASRKKRFVIDVAKEAEDYVKIRDVERYPSR